MIALILRILPFILMMSLLANCTFSEKVHRQSLDQASWEFRQVGKNNWHEWLDDPTIADAILDRLVPRSHRLELKGKSLRKNIKTIS